MPPSGTYRTVERAIRRYYDIHGKPGRYVVTVKYRGRRAQGSASTLAEARDLRSELSTKLRSPQYDPRAGRRSVADAISRYYRSDLYARLSAKERKGREASLGWWEAKLGALPLSDLGPPALADLRDMLLEEEGLSAATVNRRLSHLSVSFRPALEAGWIASNPVRGIIRPTEDPELGEILTDAEVLRLLEACQSSEDHRLRYLVPCLLSTGARIGEYMTTRHQDVDLVRGTSLVRRGKSGKARILHYHGRGLEALRAAMQVRSITGYLWASRRRGGIHPPRKPIYAALKAAEITKPGAWHLLRRTCGTWLAAMGASDSEIREHLGHAPGSPATARYVLLGQVVRSDLAEEFVVRRRMVA